jgi:hypothetical protein
MYLTYFDEVKHNPPAQNSYLLAGIAVHINDIASLESEVNALAKSFFGSSLLNKGTEFHGVDIFQGKGNFKGIKFEDRLELLKSLVEIVCDGSRVIKVWVQINPGNITHTSKSPEDIGFMYFVECVDKKLSELGSKGVLFGDYDDPVIAASVASLSRFREGGTEWERRRNIECLVDTVHFAHSHHSRLIQLADIFAYSTQFRLSGNDSSWTRKQFMDFLKDEANVLQDCESRSWPTMPIWFGR